MNRVLLLVALVLFICGWGDATQRVRLRASALRASESDGFHTKSGPARSPALASKMKEVARKAKKTSEVVQKTTQARKYAMCSSKVFEGGVYRKRLCIPRDCSRHMANKVLSLPNGIDITNVLPTCVGGESPCTPDFVNVSIPIAPQVLPDCPRSCGDGQEWKRPAVCMPWSLQGARVPGLSSVALSRCPLCVQPCMPPELNLVMNKTIPSFVNLPVCKKEACDLERIPKFCISPEMRHLPDMVPLIGIVPMCAKCESMCIPKFVKFKRTKTDTKASFVGLLSKCPRKKVKGPLQKTVCLPKQLRHIKLTELGKLAKHMPTCTSKQTPCLPRIVKALLPRSLRLVLDIPVCHPQSCGTGTHAACLPDYFNSIKLPHEIAPLKRKMRRCRKCERMCMPYFFHLNTRDFPLFKKLVPTCKRAACTKRSKELCMPPTLKHTKLGAHLPKVGKCKVCSTLCIPNVMRRQLDIPSFIKAPNCPDFPPRCGGGNTYKFCRAKSLSLAWKDIPFVGKLDLPTCKPCEGMCVPKYLNVKSLPLGMGSVVPRCRAANCKRKDSAVCIPKPLLREMKQIKGKMPHILRPCEKCMTPCLTPMIKKGLKGVHKFLVAQDCKNYRKECKSGMRTKRFCYTPQLRLAMQTIPGMGDLPLPRCQPCEDPCMPHTFKFPSHIPKFLPSCPREKCVKRKPEAMCLPHIMRGVNLKTTQRLVVCPKCVPACLSSQVDREMGIAKYLDFPVCGRPRCSGKKTHAVCVPHHLRKSSIKYIKGLLPVCPRCTFLCQPRGIKIVLPFVNQAKCPSRRCPGGKKKQKEAFCIPWDLRLTTIPLFKSLGIKPCKRCEKPCIPEDIQIGSLPLGLKLPTCRSRYKKCPYKKHDVCMPPMLAKLGVSMTPPSKTCPDCVAPCVPNFEPRVTLPKGLVLPQCPQASCDTKENPPVPTFCLPRSLAFRNDTSIRKMHMQECAGCQTPCVPRPMLPMVPKILKENMNVCPAHHGETELTKCGDKIGFAFCMPKGLKISDPTVYQKYEHLLTECSDCTLPCAPESFLKHDPSLRVFKACPKPKCDKPKLAHMCIPAAYRQLSIPSLDRLGLKVCKPCQEPCYPADLALQLPKGMEMEKCPSALLHGEFTGCKNVKHRVCVPQGMHGSFNYTKFGYMARCPDCVRACSSKYMPRKLPISVKACPEPNRNAKCRQVAYAACIPQELKALNVDVATIESCTTCQKACSMTGLMNFSQAGLIFPDCPGADKIRAQIGQAKQNVEHATITVTTPGASLKPSMASPKVQTPKLMGENMTPAQIAKAQQTQSRIFAKYPWMKPQLHHVNELPEAAEFYPRGVHLTRE